MALAGAPEEAIRSLERAFELADGSEPQRSRWMEWMAKAHFAAGRYGMAVEWASRSVENPPPFPGDLATAYQTLAASHAQAGDLSSAREALMKALEIRPSLDRGWVDIFYSTASQDHRDRYLEGLLAAGLEESREMTSSSEPLPAGADGPGILILPFDNVLDEPELVGLARGIPLRLLDHYRELKGSGVGIVRDPASGPTCSAGGAGEGVMVFEGRVQSVGDKLQVRVDLVICPGEEQLWSDDYTRDASDDLLRAQEEIARAIFETSLGTVDQHQ